MAVRPAATQFVKPPSQKIEPKPSAKAKMVAARGVISPVTSGRFSVRRIFASMSRSAMQLKTEAEAAAAAPPISVATTSQRFGRPRSARNMTRVRSCRRTVR